MTFSMLEIYNESINDLLDSTPTSFGKEREKLDIRQTPEGNVVPGLTEVTVRYLGCIRNDKYTQIYTGMSNFYAIYCFVSSLIYSGGGNMGHI
jgi:Kinesin motor domain